MVHLDAAWSDYQRFLELRGERSTPRISFLEGVVQFLRPSRQHEVLKSRIGCLVEVWCLERGVEFQTLGSWTLENKEKARGLEPDECYVFSADLDGVRPDLAIEVIWTSGGLDKREIYRALGVPELWFWRRGVITVYALRGGAYEEIASSEVLPGIDLRSLVTFLDRPSQAIRDCRASLASAR